MAPRKARIVMSTLPVDRLPRRMSEGGCREVVNVKYSLTENDMKLKNRQIWKLKKKYWRAEFAFVVKFGPADLQFEIVGMNGLLNREQASLQCDFLDPYMSKMLPKSPGPQSSLDSPMVGPKKFWARQKFNVPPASPSVFSTIVDRNGFLAPDKFNVPPAPPSVTSTLVEAKSTPSEVRYPPSPPPK
jgi:hypothetical protein